MSVSGVFLVRIFPHSDWLRRDRSIYLYSVRMRENADQKNSEYRDFSRSGERRWVFRFLLNIFDGTFLRKKKLLLKPLTVFEKSSIMNVLWSPKYASRISLIVLGMLLTLMGNVFNLFGFTWQKMLQKTFTDIKLSLSTYSLISGTFSAPSQRAMQPVIVLGSLFVIWFVAFWFGC